MDLSKIDFETLSDRFKQSKRKNNLHRSPQRGPCRLRREVRRIDRVFRTPGTRNIEELFEELPKPSCSFSEEQQRHVRENLSEEQLVIFDILTSSARSERPQVSKQIGCSAATEWTSWRCEDGRFISDLRAEYIANKVGPNPEVSFRRSPE
jgi:type I restriction enzyme, R subunit